MKPISKTNHIQSRMRQRGMSEKSISLVYQFGKQRKYTDKVEMDKKMVETLSRDLIDLIKVMEKQYIPGEIYAFDITECHVN